MFRKMQAILLLLLTLSFTLSASAQTGEGIDPEALIEQILSVAQNQRDQLDDLVMEAELIEGKRNDKGELKEEHRFDKKIYIKYLPDTILYHEEFLTYYKEGEPQEEKKLREEAKKRIEQREKRNTRNASYPMLRPFYPENRKDYEIEYIGVAEQKIAEHVCHHFLVTSKEEDPDHINGDYYFEAASFYLVRADFSPAKLTKKMMFRMNRLDMSITYQPVVEDLWLPTEFQIDGKGKAALFFGVSFSVVERYSNHQVNVGLDLAMFEESDGE